MARRTGVHRGCNADGNAVQSDTKPKSGKGSAKLDTMVVLRHMIGSDPSIEVAEEEPGNGSVVTVMFDAHPPRVARTIEQEQSSVVLRDARIGPDAWLSDIEQATQITRVRGIARLLSLRYWVIWLESNWVVAALGLSILALLFCSIRMRQGLF